MLGRVKLPYDQIRKFIIEMDANQLPEAMVKQFLTAVPTNEEVELLKDFVGGNEAKLKEVGKAELFLWEVRLILQQARAAQVGLKMKENNGNR